ncbi:leucine-rich repeat domain-containing protein [Fusibacter bizertensis]
MKCPKCGKAWNEISRKGRSHYICPQCGVAFNSEKEVEDQIENALSWIVEEYGFDILSEINRVNALLMDLAPNQEKKRKLLIALLKEGIHKRLCQYLGLSTEDMYAGIMKCEREAVNALWITKEAAHYVVGAIALSMGLTKFDEASPECESILNKEQSDSVCQQNALLAQYTVIGYKAFASKSELVYLRIPQNIVAIKAKAFFNCVNLREIVLPDTLESIGKSIFEGCSSLREITINDNKNYTVVKGMLIDKKNKAILWCCNSDDAEICQIPNGIATVYEKAFDRNRLKSVIIPKTVKEIEKRAFYLTMLFESYQVDYQNLNFCAINGVLHTKRRERLLHYPQGRKDINYVIEDTVSSIGDSAFSCVRYLETITFTPSLKSIGAKAFEYCEKLENIVLTSNVISIGERAFQYCEKIKSVMLPRSIKEIGDYAFYNCCDIVTLSIPKDVMRIGHMTFANCHKLIKVVIQDSVKFIGDGAFIGCDNLTVYIRSNAYVEAYCQSHGIKYNQI